MIALDTNVLVRLLVSDDLAQQQMVQQRLTSMRDAGESALVSHVVLAELSWVLRAVYDYSREPIADALEKLAATSPFYVPSAHVVGHALEWYRKGNAEFADYLILSLSLSEGASRLLTFDRKLLKHNTCEVP